jgi:hypothetical protein
MRWTGHVACMGELRNAYKILVTKAERKIPLRKPRHRWQHNVKINLRNISVSKVTLLMDWMIEDSFSAKGTTLLFIAMSRLTLRPTRLLNGHWK